VLNKFDDCVLDEQIDKLNVPMSILLLRKHLIPDGKENITSKELNSQLAKIENQLNLSPQAKRCFRKLLFPSNKDINNINKVDYFPTQTKDMDSRIMSRNSTILETQKAFPANIGVLQSITCTGIIKR